MANPIRTSDLYQDTGDLKRLIAELEQVQGKLEMLRKNEIQNASKLQASMRKLNASTSAQRDQIEKGAKEADEITKRYKKFTESLDDNAVKLAALKNAQRQLNQVNKLEAKLLASKEGSYNALSAQYSLNKLRLNQMTKEERKSTEAGQELEKQTFEIFQEMKRLQEATGKTSLNVGNYTSAIGNASKEQKKFAEELKAVRAEYKLYQKSTQVSAEKTKEYEDRIEELTDVVDNLGAVTGKTSKDFEEGLIDKLSKTEGAAGSAVQGIKGVGQSLKALLANPVVLFLAAIAGALITLFNAFKRSEKGAELMAKATGVVNAFMSNLTEIAVKVAEKVEAAFNDPIGAVKELGQAILNNVLNRIKALPLLAKAGLDALKALWNRDMDALKQAGTDAFTAVNQAITGLDATQQSELAEAIRETTEEAIRETEAFVKLEQAKRGVRRANRELVKSIEALTTAEELQQVIADDTTKSFAEREAAAEKARQALEARAGKEIQLARNNLSLLNTEISLRRRNGEEIEDLLDRQLEGYRALAAAERQLTVATAQNEKTRAELKQDRLERDLDILIDGFDNQKTINERLLKDEQIAFDERTALLDETRRLADESFAKQIETIEQFTDVAVNANELIAESDAVALNEKIRSLGLSEIIEGRLLEIVRERRLVTQDLAEAEAELAERIAKAKEAERKAQESALKAQRDAAMEKFDQEQALAKSEFDLLKSTEAEKTAFRLQAERDRLQKILDINKEFNGELTDLQIATIKNQIAAIDNEINSAKGKFTDIYSAFGFKISDEEKDAFNEAIGFAKDQIAQLADARVQAANRAVESSEREVESAQENLNATIALAEQGYAVNVEDAQRELDLAKETQRKAVEQQKKAERQKRLVETLSQASSLVTAAARILAEVPFPASLIAVGTMFGSFALSKIKAARATREFRDGDYTVLRGAKHRGKGTGIPLGIAADGVAEYAEGGEGRAIFTAKAVNKYGGEIERVVNEFNSLSYESRTPVVNASLIGGGGSEVDTSRMEDNLTAIRKNSERRYFVNGDGQLVEQYKNRTRVYVN